MVTVIFCAVFGGGFCLFISRFLIGKNLIGDFFSISAGVLVGFFVGAFIADQIGNFLPKKTVKVGWVTHTEFVSPTSYYFALCPVNKKYQPHIMDKPE